VKKVPISQARIFKHAGGRNRKCKSETDLRQFKPRKS